MNLENKKIFGDRWSEEMKAIAMTIIKNPYDVFARKVFWDAVYDNSMSDSSDIQAANAAFKSFGSKITDEEDKKAIMDFWGFIPNLPERIFGYFDFKSFQEGEIVHFQSDAYRIFFDYGFPLFLSSDIFFVASGIYPSIARAYNRISGYNIPVESRFRFSNPYICFYMNSDSIRSEQRPAIVGIRNSNTSVTFNSFSGKVWKSHYGFYQHQNKDLSICYFFHSQKELQIERGVHLACCVNSQFADIDPTNWVESFAEMLESYEYDEEG